MRGFAPILNVPSQVSQFLSQDWPCEQGVYLIPVEERVLKLHWHYQWTRTFGYKWMRKTYGSTNLRFWSQLGWGVDQVNITWDKPGNESYTRADLKMEITHKKKILEYDQYKLTIDLKWKIQLNWRPTKINHLNWKENKHSFGDLWDSIKHPTYI